MRRGAEGARRGQAAESVFERRARTGLRGERSRQGSMTDGDGDGGISHGWEEDPGPNVLRLPHPFPFHLHPFCQLLKRCGESHSVCMVFSAERQWRLAPCSLAAKRSWGCRPVLCLLVVSSAELPILTSAFLILFRVQ